MDGGTVPCWHRLVTRRSPGLLWWGSDYPHSESTFPQSRKILAEIPEGVPDEQTKIVGLNTARVYNFDVARLSVPR